MHTSEQFLMCTTFAFALARFGNRALKYKGNSAVFLKKLNFDGNFCCSKNFFINFNILEHTSQQAASSSINSAQHTLQARLFIRE